MLKRVGRSGVTPDDARWVVRGTGEAATAHKFRVARRSPELKLSGSLQLPLQQLTVLENDSLLSRAQGWAWGRVRVGAGMGQGYGRTPPRAAARARRCVRQRFLADATGLHVPAIQQRCVHHRPPQLRALCRRRRTFRCQSHARRRQRAGSLAWRPQACCACAYVPP